jgi:hypothetical protein
VIVELALGALLAGGAIWYVLRPVVRPDAVGAGGHGAGGNSEPPLDT